MGDFNLVKAERDNLPPSRQGIRPSNIEILMNRICNDKSYRIEEILSFGPPTKENSEVIKNINRREQLHKVIERLGIDSF